MTKKTVFIFYDMDGTLYNLYKVPNWLERLQAGDATVYGEKGYKMFNSSKLSAVTELASVAFDGKLYQGIITWLAMERESYNNTEFFEESVLIKQEWAENNACGVELFRALPYGAPKHETAEQLIMNRVAAHDEVVAILVDDNREVRKAWKEYFHSHAQITGCVINANRSFLTPLTDLLADIAVDVY